MSATTDSPTPNEQAIALGKAVRALRDRAGLTQDQAAAEIGVTRQAWQNYEAGHRNSILRTDLQDRLAGALKVSRAAIIRERDRQLGTRRDFETNDTPPDLPYDIPVLTHARTGPDGPTLYGVAEPDSTVDMAWMFSRAARGLRVAGDSMTGYVESGQLVIYDTSLWPTRGDGCVVEMQSGEVYVRTYVETGQGVLKLKQLFPADCISIPMSEVKGVYKIRGRMN